MPPPPPPPARPASQRTGLTAALLNLSGLGLGYVYLRLWLRVLPSLVALGLLLLLALPVEARGIDGLWVVLYGVWLLAAAADGYRLGRRPQTPAAVWGAPPVRPKVPAPLGRGGAPWIPLTLGVLLLALPATSVVWFEDARMQALEDDLQERLAVADELVDEAGGMPFGRAEDRYTEALNEYLAVHDEYPDTDAAGEVPARVDAVYEQATENDDSQDACERLVPLRYFRELPGSIEGEQARRLARQATESLPEPLHGCGMLHLDREDTTAARAPLAELLEEHGESEQATELPEELGARQRAAIDGIGGSAPCGALDQLRALTGLFEELPGEPFTELADEGAEPVPEGLFQCGVEHYGDGDFTTAEETLRSLVGNHPDHVRYDRARDILIATQIAQELPSAGDRLPPLPGATGGATVEVRVLNDSPYEQETLYTGPETDTSRIPACEDCTVYATDPGDNACSDSGRDYPSRTLRVPAGTYYFLHRSADQDTDPLAEREVLDSNYIYTWCRYVTEESLTPDLGLPEFELPELEPPEFDLEDLEGVSHRP